MSITLIARDTVTGEVIQQSARDADRDRALEAFANLIAIQSIETGHAFSFEYEQEDELDPQILFAQLDRSPGLGKAVNILTLGQFIEMVGTTSLDTQITVNAQGLQLHGSEWFNVEAVELPSVQGGFSIQLHVADTFDPRQA